MSTFPASASSNQPASAGLGLSASGGQTPAFSPLYQQIKDLLLQSLQRGEWKPSEAIPSEMDLAKRFGVSQGTVRKAVDELAAENLLVRRQGRGTFVATHSEQQVRYRFLRLRPDQDAPEALPTQRDFISVKPLRASAEIARLLAMKTGDGVLQARRLLRFGGRPTILEDIWLPSTAFKGLTAERLAQYHGPTYALFESEFGVRMVRADEKIRAVLPDEAQCQLLETSPGTPLLSVERLSYTYNDVPMELRRGLYRTDSHHYWNQLI